VNILNFAPSNLCNICTNLAHGINKYTNHNCRSVTLRPTLYGFDVDILLKKNEDLVESLIDKYDILHLNSWYFTRKKMISNIFGNIPLSIIRCVDVLYNKCNLSNIPKFPNIDMVWWYYFTHKINKYKIGEKNVVLQYHGGDLRRAMSETDKKFINRHKFKVLVSVPDLLPQLERAQWLPIPVPTDNELYTPLQKKEDDVIKIVHTPTGRGLKKTGALIRAVKALKLKYDIRLMLIENMPYRHCLKLRREAHISFDNIEFGSYAGCSIEAMCHEQPTLVYLNEISQEQIDRVSDEIGVESPFVNVGDPKQPSVEYLNKVVVGKARNVITEKDYRSVYDSLEQLIVDSTLRKEIGKRGRKWACKVHDERVVVRKLIDIYES